jgi:hypothetical protein
MSTPRDLSVWQEALQGLALSLAYDVLEKPELQPARTAVDEVFYLIDELQEIHQLLTDAGIPEDLPDRPADLLRARVAYLLEHLTAARRSEFYNSNYVAQQRMF